MALVTILRLVVSPAAPLIGAVSRTAPRSASSADQPVDGGWPRAYATPSGGNILVYQPQVVSWDEQKRIVGFSAVSYQSQGAQKPELGTIKIEAATTVATDERLVSFAPLTITQANFPSLSKEQTSEVVREIEKVFPDEERVIALDRVLANIDKSQIVPKNVEGVKADPPPIFFSEKPAVLLGFDGDPVWSPIESNDLKFAVNTNWDVFQHAPTVTYYVRNEETWLKASALEGPWQPAGKLPESFQKLPNDDNWKEVKASLPGKKLSTKKMPTVFVSYAPAELILLEGEPKYEPVTGTNLLWVSNTESDLFRMGKDGPVYVEPAEAGGVTYFVSAGDHYLPYLEPTGQELYIRVNGASRRGRGSRHHEIRAPHGGLRRLAQGSPGDDPGLGEEQGGRCLRGSSRSRSGSSRPDRGDQGKSGPRESARGEARGGKPGAAPRARAHQRRLWR